MPRKFRKTLLSILVLIFILGGTYWYFQTTYPTTSPLSSAGYFLLSLFRPHEKLTHHVMGFLPYWRTDDASSIRPHLLSEVNYFSISPDADGTIRKVVNSETEPGWREWNSEKVKNLIARTQIAGADFTITLVTHENDVIESILKSSQAQDSLITELLTEVKEKKLDGVTIDFEYFGEADVSYRDAFTLFSKKLADKFEQEAPRASLSLSAMPLAARQNDLFDFPRIAPLYDRFIGMSYDFYGQSSDIAGPIAPMKGFKENKIFFDTETMYEDFSKVLPKGKIVMGVPYYGWDWAVTDGKTKHSTTLSADDPNNYAAVMSYARMKENKDLKKNQCAWDEYALETWCWYTKEGVDHQVWFHDEKSLGTRYDYAKKQQFSGIAIWVLTYDKGRNELWDLLKKNFTR